MRMLALLFPFLLFASELEQYEWKHRIVLIFTPSESHPLFQKTQTLYRDEIPNLAKRRILWINLIADEGDIAVPTKHDYTLPDAMAIRKRYGIKPNDFATSLIGLDGGEKLRLYETVEPEYLYRTIDAMPIRRMEMQNR